MGLWSDVLILLKYCHFLHYCVLLKVATCIAENMARSCALTKLSDICC